MTQEDPLEGERRQKRALWVAREIIPSEAHIRRWLSRSRVERDVADDLIQEAYCRIALLDDVNHIDSPPAYFFSIVKSLLVRRLKRQRVVSLEAVAEMEAPQDLLLSVEEAMANRHAYRQVMSMIANLPDRCRKIVQLRKVEGWSQKQIASHLGTTEKAVEKQLWLGLRSIRQAWSAVEQEGETSLNRPAKQADRR
jgi:RNA polymerase sigma factor (sigma-70 family)